jgi:hypothetical protein
VATISHPPDALGAGFGRYFLHFLVPGLNKLPSANLQLQLSVLNWFPTWSVKFLPAFASTVILVLASVSSRQMTKISECGLIFDEGGVGLSVQAAAVFVAPQFQHEYVSAVIASRPLWAM